MATAPLLRQLVARVPFHRARIVLAIVASTALVWAVVLLWPGRGPLGLLVIGVQIWRYRHKTIGRLRATNPALDALRDGHSLLPGISQGTNR